MQCQLKEGAKKPMKHHESDAGFDLFALCEEKEMYTVWPKSRKVIHTGVSVKIPENYCGFIKPRSGLAVKFGIDVLGGVIDSGYTGELKVILYNSSNKRFFIKNHQKIAQLVCLPIMQCSEMEVVEELFNDSENQSRGKKGFGSSGDFEPI